MARKKKLITTKEVSRILKVSSEVVTYLRTEEGLPYVKHKKYILFSEPEVTRWRNARLSSSTKKVMNLLEYYTTIRLFKFCTYEEFKARVLDSVFMEEDYVVKYIERQSPEKDVQNIVGDIVSEYWDKATPKCKVCGRKLISKLYNGLCHICANK